MSLNLFPLAQPHDELISPPKLFSTKCLWWGLLLWLLSATGQAGIESVTWQPNLETYSRLTPEVTAIVKLTESTWQTRVKFE